MTHKPPAYQVTRQAPWDGDVYIEIALGPDEVSPGMLVAKYDEEGEYATAAEAVDAALALAVAWASLNDETHEWERPPIATSSAASIGAYPSADDGKDEAELRAWAERRAAIDQEEDDEEYDPGWVEEWEDDLQGDGDA